MAEAASPILFERRGAVGWLMFDRPARRNAIDAATHLALREALTAVEADRAIRALVITGAGGAFCSGQDLAERRDMLAEGEVDLQASLVENYSPLIRRLIALPMPVIAAVGGVAAGAGVGLVLAADIVLAGASARFQLPFVKVGLGPDCGLSWTLARQVGLNRALALLLTGDAFDADEAFAWGLVSRVCPDEALAAEAEALAARLARGPRAAIAAIKRSVREAADQTLDEALAAEAIMQGGLGRDPDYREAVIAFTSKREPRFR
ncbi:enoyl-CoA hydratase [Sphingobium indicum]|uniref:Enoyl-CoA hydratase n=2 Tax=Sphingobium indicum TaxID=332055 RepID=A0A1L5BTB4_SPHIB|nr:enoyl-CoA hydratase-related protein [Sphingobium indicum]APL96119.1 enoyl-CoA hydratase [Sphingobium indicum B90A]KEY99561.1 enoyl-CoA hydratase [Sphingomonas sp. BHC-A]NYI24110.1 2-(1,2-epoxy-1,2-dihydrophenyl)acetyl-CoA isomerase [Sphingobium indicum]RYL99176.1 enoyl-CoA hydratase [Sphingobium indicum]